MGHSSLLNHLRCLIPYLKPHKKALGLSLVLSLVSTALGMIQPYFAKLFIDNVFLSKNLSLLPYLVGLLIFLLILGFVIRVSNSYIYTRYSALLLFKMREDLFEHVHKIPLRFFAKRKIGDMYSRIASDMADIQGLLTETIPHNLFNFLTLLFTAGILLWLNPTMALMSFAFVPAGLYIIHKLRPRLMELSRNVAETNADIAHFLFESLSNTSLIRAFGAEGAECARLKENQSRILGLLLRHQVLGAVSGAVPTAFMIVNTVVVFGYGGLLVMRGDLTIGSLVAFSIYQGRVLSPLRGLMEGFLAVQKSLVALARVREIQDIDPDMSQMGFLTLPDEALRGDVAMENVSFAYEKDEPVLKDVSFEIPAGRVTALVGSSGAGKTTLCHLVMRLFDPDRGRITLDGRDLRAYRTDWLRKKITLVSQDIFLFHASILENIRFARPDAAADEVMEAARAACIHDFIESLPRGYHEMVGDRGTRLSGGQKQRISIARSILLGPQVLILDEATAFLDTAVESRLQETLHGLMDGRTILVVSHRSSAIREADKIVVCEKGGLVYDGPIEGWKDERACGSN